MRERKLKSTIVGVGKNADEPQAIREALDYLPMEYLKESIQF
ncbi:hypothetical protein [Clostridium thailandense]|nr:hypothetical protein [Clostridium thailandense]